MPRRRASQRGRGVGHKPRLPSRGDAKLKKWNLPSDIPLDEEDQFHASRDKLLLSGNETLDDDDEDEEEVFGLEGIDGTEDEEDGDEDDGEEEEISDGGDTMQSIAPKASKSPKSKKETAETLSASEQSEEETWGRKKSAYYSSNADQIDSDDEEANELEEQEAKRLQMKSRQQLGDQDFGLQDIPEADTEHSNPLAEPVPPPVPQLQPMDKKSAIRHLEKTSPETLALARDWDETVWNLIKTKEKVERFQTEHHDEVTMGMVHLHYQTLLTYATTLAFYLHLRSSEKYIRRPELLTSHPISSRLLTLKRSLTTLEDLDFTTSDFDEDEDDELDFGMEGDADFPVNDEQSNLFNHRGGLETNELRELLQDAKSTKDTSKTMPSHTEPPTKKRKKSASKSHFKLPQFDLVEPVYTKSKGLSDAFDDSLASDAFGEVSLLHHVDAADKSSRRKSLRFHTAKIESASARRQGARTHAMGGDDDLPYKERKKEKDLRLAKEAASKSRGQGGEDLLEGDQVSELGVKEGKRKREQDSASNESEDDGYYELIKKASKEKKEKKKIEYESLRSSTRLDIDEKDPSSGPRSLTRAILANKGLTPHRAKSVRNPRVKKRQKFEQAKKKVSSQKAVYKGGLADTGRYDGEKSGISKVVKSIRLG